MIWIYRGYQQSEAYLKDQLSKALAATVQDLETKEEIVFIARMSSEEEADTIVNQQVTLVQRKSFSSDSMVEFRSTFIDSVVAEIGAEEAERVLGAEQQEVIRMEVFSSSDSISSRAEVKWAEDSALDHVLKLSEDGRLMELVQKIERENVMGREDWKSRIDSASFHESLLEQTKVYGIESKVEFRVVDANGNAFDQFQSADDQAFEEGIAARAALFPADLRSKGVFAEAGVTSVTAEVFKRLWWMVLLSLGFTALMVVLFVVIMRKLLSQSRLSQLKTDFINNMSHELKTPLATISLAADAMLHPESQKDSRMLESFVSTIRQEHKRMHVHIERVLQMAEAQQGEFQLRREKQDLRTLVSEAVDSMKLLLEKSDAEVQLSLPEEEVQASVDVLHITAAIGNLIDNALKYNERKPELRISLRKEGAAVLMECCDNGIGIAPDHHELIFSRFYRVQAGDVHDQKGFGLGLSYVAMVAQAHGGSIALTSTLGQGSCFTLSIPRP